MRGSRASSVSSASRSPWMSPMAKVRPIRRRLRGAAARSSDRGAVSARPEGRDGEGPEVVAEGQLLVAEMEDDAAREPAAGPLGEGAEPAEVGRVDGRGRLDLD